MKISMIRYFLIIVFSFLLPACGFVNGEILSLTPVSEELPTPSKEELKLILNLQSPTFDIYDMSQPTIKISGTVSGGQVKLFSDANCLSEVASGIASGSEFLATSTSLADGIYPLSARAQNSSGSWSSCYVMSGTYTLDSQAPVLQSVTPATVPTSGAQVSISGSHFNAGLSVTIGGQLCANLTFVNSGQVLCRAPSSSQGNYDVTISKPNGTTQNSVAAISYSDPAPQAPLCFSDQVGLIKPLDTEIFVSGSFTSVGTCVGSAVPVNLAGGVVNAAIGEFPQFAGDISAVIDDGAGGFFIAGSFSKAGSYSRTNMAHVNSNNLVDLQFNSSPSALIVGDNQDIDYLSQVSGILKDANSLLVYGRSSQAQSRIPSRLTSYQAVTGSLAPHQIEINGGYGVINTIISDSQGGYFIGGDFTWVNGLPIKNLVHMTSSGAVDLLFMPNPDDRVTGLALNGNTLYVGGYFGYVFNQLHKGVMGIDLINGLALNWTLRVGYVDQLAFYGGKLYFLGIFNSVWTQAQGNLIRNGSAAIDVTTGEPIPWTMNNWGTAAMVGSPDGIYVGGSFTSISGTAVNTGLALVNPTTGALINTWSNLVPSGVSSILLSGTTLYLAGGFTTIAGQTRNHLAAIDTSSATLSNWNPDAGVSGNVSKITQWNNSIFALGDFTQIGGSPRNGYASIDAITGTANSWSPPVGDWGASLPIFADSGNVFLGSYYRQSGPRDIGMISRVDAATGQQLSWRLQADGPINTAVLLGSKIYIGGNFSSINGMNRANFAVINKDTGLLETWNPSFNGSINQLEVLGNQLAIRGEFTSVNGQTRNYLAALDANLEQLTPWNPNLDYMADAMTSNGVNTVWIGGYFSSIGGQSRDTFAAIDFSTGLPSSWSLSLTGDSPTFLKYQNSKLYMSGNFTQINGQPRNFFVTLNPMTESLSPDTLSIGGPLKGLAISGSRAYAVGSKSFSINNRLRSGAALVDKTTGSLKPWTAFFEKNPGGFVLGSFTITTATYNSSTLYIGGAFDYVNGQVRKGLAAFNRSDGSLLSWNPDAKSSVFTIELDGNSLYVGGNFNKINGVNRTMIGTVDATTGALLPWNPSSPGCISKFLKSGRLLYSVGCFDTFMGLTRPYLAAIDLDLGNLTAWTPAPDYATWDIDLCNNTIYVMGDFRRIGGQGRRRYGAVSTTTGLATPFAPEPDNSPRFKCVGSKVYMAGAQFVGGKKVATLSQVDSTTGIADSWHPETSQDTMAGFLASENNILYIGGDLSNLSGYPRGGFIKLNTTDNSVADPW